MAASNLTGFARQAAVAYQLGIGRAADLFLVAFSIPEFAFIALPIVLSPVLIPLFINHRLRAGEANAWRFSQHMAGALLGVLLVFTLLAAVAAPTWVRWLAPSFGPREHVLSVRAMRLMLPAIVLMGLAALFGAVLQVYRRFARPALATTIYNLAFVATLLGWPLVWARPDDLNPGGPVARAAWAVTTGAAAALLFQLPFLWRHRPSPSARVAQEDREEPFFSHVRQAARLTGPILAGYAVHHVILWVDRAMATSLGPGRAAALNYAYHLALVVGQVSGLAISTAFFPRLAEQAASKDTSGIRDSVARALRLVLLIGLPATCGLELLRNHAVQLLLERGAFGAEAAVAVSQPLAWYALAVLADALCQPLWRVVYAWRRPWTVLAINGLQTAVRLAGNFALIPAFGYNGLAISAAIGLSIQVGILGWWVWRHTGRSATRAWHWRITRIILATAVASGAMAIVSFLRSSAPPSFTSSLVTLLASGALGGVVYLAMLVALKEFSLWHTSFTLYNLADRKGARIDTDAKHRENL